MTPTPAIMAARPGAIQRFADLLRSEACKLASVRSTMWALLAAVVFNVVLAALAAIFLPARLSATDLAHADAIRLSLAGLHLSQIAVGTLGVLVITSEYTTGAIRTTLAAVPQRRLMFAAKASVFAATALLVGVIACLAAYLVFQALLTGGPLKSSLADPGVLRAVTGGGLYLATLGLLGLGLGAIIRSSAGAITALFGLLFVPSILTDILPGAWRATIAPYLPMNAGDSIYLLNPEPGGLGTWTGYGVFALYAAAALGTGFILITRRDA